MIDLEQYKLIVESSPNMIWRANRSAECDYFNKTWLDFTGRTFEQEYGYGWAEGVHPDDLKKCVEHYMNNFKKQRRFEMNYRLKRYDGEYRWINDRGVPIYGKEGQFLGFIGSCMDITEKIEGQQLLELAQYDSLCHTYTRQYSYLLLAKELKQAEENGSPLCLMMIDIDNFKNINDTYGHAAGDSVLTAAAGIIKREIREFDILGRYGGDEFIVGLIRTNHASSLAVSKRICDAVASTDIPVSDSKLIRITVSIGAYCFESGQTLDELVNNADKKLYEAKKKGKNLVIL